MTGWDQVKRTQPRAPLTGWLVGRYIIIIIWLISGYIFTFFEAISIFISRRRIPLTITLFTGGLLAVTAYGFIHDKPPDWWAAWGQWVGGIGSIFAGLVAIWIALEGWRRSERRSTVDSVRYAIWIEFSNQTELVIRHLNASQMPVYDVFIRITISELGRTISPPHSIRDRIPRLGTVGPMSDPHHFLTLRTAYNPGSQSS